MMKKAFSKIYLALVYLFLYAPIFVLIVFSFNDSKSKSHFTGFSLRWYEELFENEMIMSSLLNTLVLALISSIIATLIGTLAAIGIYSMKKRARSAIMAVTNMPMVNPEVVTGISMMLLFVFVASIFDIQQGFYSVLIAHITFNLPYVILSVLPKLYQVNINTFEAALDLGCTPRQAFFKVIIPEIMPGIFSGFLMAVTLSLDDFLISYFTSGSDFQTLPVTIYSMLKKQVPPSLNALSALLFLAVLIILLISNISAIRKEKAQMRH
ncbi:MAG: ABC transporter permease [Oscillospiraceae bacterium]|nr:ABC transporter permease [Oscillospiraceae bacterium]